MTVRVDFLQALGVIQIRQDEQILFLPRHEASDFLGQLMRELAGSIPDPIDDDYSRKVPDVPALRLVGGDVG